MHDRRLPPRPSARMVECAWQLRIEFECRIDPWPGLAVGANRCLIDLQVYERFSDQCSEQYSCKKRTTLLLSVSDHHLHDQNVSDYRPIPSACANGRQARPRGAGGSQTGKFGAAADRRRLRRLTSRLDTSTLWFCLNRQS